MRFFFVIMILLVTITNCSPKENSKELYEKLRIQIGETCEESPTNGLYYGKACVKEEKSLSCVKIIREIKQNGLEDYIFGKSWTQPIHKFRKYEISNEGIVSITHFWPNDPPETYKIKSKFYKKNGRLFYFQPEEGSSNDGELHFEIKYVGCVTDVLNIKMGMFITLIISDGIEKTIEKSRRPIQIYNQKNYLQLDSPYILKEPEVWHTASTDI